MYTVGPLLLLFGVCFLVILEYTKLMGISLIIFTIFWFIFEMYIVWIIL